MPEIRDEDIRGYRIGRETVCVDDTTDTEKMNATIKQIITAQELDDREVSIFCDRCGEQI